MASTILVNLVIWFLMLPSAASGGQVDWSAQSRSPHGNLNIACQNCHTVSGWKPIRAIPEFDHDKTRYPLRGMHQNVSCTQCHTKPVFTNVGSKCADCHADIHKRQMGANCEQCHTVKGWNVSVQQINQHQNRFPLIGAHAALNCDSCHKGAATGQFQGLSTQCYSCHAADYQKTTGPNHVTAGFSPSCEQCHTMNTWTGVAFDHLKFTGFALSGAHATLDCTACHIGGKYKGTPANCVGCHLKDFQKTTNPNHVTLGLPQTCQMCHSTSAWQPASFDHNLVGFPLTGAHATLQCSQCHSNGNFKLNSADCVSCHLKNYQDTKNPNHQQAGIPTTCATCHNTTSWGDAKFNHANTGFPLTGKHVNLQCAQCHVNGNYNLKDTSCVSCHLKDYQGTKDPNHVQAGFPTSCETCHSTSSWSANFNHDGTGFPLTGGHKTLQCSQCHVNGNYKLTDTSCVSCHLKDYQATNDPNHVQAGFPTTCEQCHTTNSWGTGGFNHDGTGFPLTGAHKTLPCQQCHVNGNYKLSDSSCVSCHLKDYQGVKDPDHVKAGFPTTCETCHSTSSWANAKFNHANTGWALTGAHKALDCSQCHVNQNYKLNDTNCVTCHLKDFTGAKDPDHVKAGFPQTCDLCHTTTAWIPSNFDHNKTPFPLTGAHTKVKCGDCHVNNNYKNLPTDCYSCHKTDYQNTNNPNHIAAGFPTTCQTCHDTSSWLGAKFDHTWFPQNHGKAKTCNDCHTNPNDFSIFTCTSCHTKAKTDQQHSDVRGYVYNSPNCYQCHPTGRGG